MKRLNITSIVNVQIWYSVFSLFHQVQQLLHGDFSDAVSNYKIIDCRYPYEYEGGHIQGAVNIYTEEGIQELVMTEDTPSTTLIFHCEFSSERGPKL